MADISADLFNRIRNRKAVVGIIGLGYVGLPLARGFAARGFAVLGFDIDSAKVEKLRRGESYIGHIGADAIQKCAARDSTRPRIFRDSGRLMSSSSACRRR